VGLNKTDIKNENTNPNFIRSSFLSLSLLLPLLLVIFHLFFDFYYFFFFSFLDSISYLLLSSIMSTAADSKNYESGIGAGPYKIPPSMYAGHRAKLMDRFAALSQDDFKYPNENGAIIMQGCMLYYVVCACLVFV
jgi:hypothetical protein